VNHALAEQGWIEFRGLHQERQRPVLIVGKGIGEAAGLAVAREIFADRGYDDSGLLAPRSQQGAVLHDPEIAARRAAAMVRDGAVIALSGKRIPVGIDSICVHGDTPGAVAMARAVRASLEASGLALRPFSA